MSQAHHYRKFKANPIEVGIFSVISLILLNSIYNLLYNNKDFRPAALTPMTANPISEGRKLASTSQALLTWKVDCEAPSNPSEETNDDENSKKPPSESIKTSEVNPEITPNKETGSSRVRLLGAFCGTNRSESLTKLIKADITNTTNRYTATVFTNDTSASFSTDYIPLNPGRNTIHIEFSYFNGNTYKRDLVIQKN